MTVRNGALSAPEQIPLRVAIQQTPETRDLPLPAYQTRDAAGMDLYAAVDAPLTVAPGERIAVPTGIHLSIPRGFEGQVRGRSGLASKHGIALANGVGTIDADYTGMVQVLLVNHGQEPFTISRGLRIAQLVVAPVAQVVWEPVDLLEETPRGSGGFGHTGLHSTVGS